MTTFPAICRHANDERAIINRHSIRFEVRVRAGLIDEMTEAPRHEWRATDSVSTHLRREAQAMQAGLANPKTVRFWTYENGGWVRLSLTDGEVIGHSRGWPTDEGYHSEGIRFERDGDIVKSEYTSYGRDCDGPHEHRADGYFHIDDAEANDTTCAETGEPYRTPDWVRGQAEQRDAFAEAAGY